ncbi:MAG: enoyl-CoA hydratase/isomerase family protein [Parachlamydiaceae bacterium]|nr:enoyl-CoA hydratase/isomerase family protein [Parachlamydiaceae bacterium]
MDYKTLSVTKSAHHVTLSLNRPDHKNSINTQLLLELNEALDTAEANQDCRVVILNSKQDVFCSGMDLDEVAHSRDKQIIDTWTHLYSKTLKRLTTSPKLIVTCLNGSVIAGGVGFVAASDWVIATENTTFKLSEALWGLIPAMVAPHLMRRIGFQKAYSLAFTTRTLTAVDAHQMHLVDLVTADLEAAVADITRRMLRIPSETLFPLKTYFHSLHPISSETEATAIRTTTNLLLDGLH